MAWARQDDCQPEDEEEHPQSLLRHLSIETHPTHPVHVPSSATPSKEGDATPANGAANGAINTQRSDRSGLALQLPGRTNNEALPTLENNDIELVAPNLPGSVTTPTPESIGQVDTVLRQSVDITRPARRMALPVSSVDLEAQVPSTIASLSCSQVLWGCYHRHERARKVFAIIAAFLVLSAALWQGIISSVRY
ncbi:hypothetical protein V501_01303 [Pseudogymnoascus sp. VKM F-4519 (FW-2642)]|nr:hypothetical protein V501_01303 [Pseudogymnoascus sp. VKM F-4519 (FW-2642)]